MSLKGLFRFPASRLSRRIALWIFFCIVLIETLIFIPSYKNREKELLSQLKDVSAARVALLMEIVKPDAGDDELFQHILKLQNDKVVIGGALYGADGRKIGEFGEMPGLMIGDVKPAGMTFMLSQDGTRYDIACSPVELKRDYRLILRHDSTSINDSLLEYFLRITGLVVIISLVLTVGIWLTLRWIVVNPILNLRQDLVRAGEALSHDQQNPEFYSATVQRNDELGEVIGAFRQMYRQIADAINERKQAEVALQASFEQVESYSRELNDELEKGRHMQINFLPGQLLQLPNWETAAYFKPARQVAGDFYDVFQVPGGGFGFVVADVCDKGVGAALFMALFRSLIRIFSGQTSLNGLPLTCSDARLDEKDDYVNNPSVDPTHVTALKAIHLTNNYIALNHGDLAMFATLFFGILDPDSGTLSKLTEGMNPYSFWGPAGVSRSGWLPPVHRWAWSRISALRFNRAIWSRATSCWATRTAWSKPMLPTVDFSPWNAWWQLWTRRFPQPPSCSTELPPAFRITLGRRTSSMMSPCLRSAESLRRNTEYRRRNTEDRCRQTEKRGWMTEDRRQKTEDG